MALLDCGRSDTAKQHLNQSLRFQQELGNSLGIAYALLGLTTVAWFQADLASALSYQQQRLEVEQALGNRAGVAHTLGGLGELAHIQADYPRAAGLYNESLALHRATGDQPGIARALAALAQIDIECGRYLAATQRLHESLEYATACALQSVIEQAKERLGIIAIARGDLSLAATILNDCMLRVRAAGHPFGIAANLRLQGELALRQGRVDDAVMFFNQAATFYRAKSNIPLLTTALCSLGWALINAGELQQAYRVFAEALPYAVKLNARAWIAELCEGLGTLAAEQDCWNDAAQAWHIADVLREETRAQQWQVDLQAHRQRRPLAKRGAVSSPDSAFSQPAPQG